MKIAQLTHSWLLILMKRKDQLRYARALGRHVRKLRQARHLTRLDALEVGIDASNLDKIEKGKRVFYVAVIPKLAKFLGVHQREITNFYFDYEANPIEKRKTTKPPGK
jgi:transcriptional regulator with XRE-family HTH domain